MVSASIIIMCAFPCRHWCCFKEDIRRSIFSYISMICVFKVCVCVRGKYFISLFFFFPKLKRGWKFLSINFLNFKQTILSAIYLILIIDLSFFDYSSEHHQNPFIKFMHCSSSFCFVWLIHTVSLHTCIFILNIMSFILLLYLCVVFYSLLTCCPGMIIKGGLYHLKKTHLVWTIYYVVILIWMNTTK